MRRTPLLGKQWTVNVKEGMLKMAVALRERWRRVIIAHIPRTTDFMYVHIIFKVWCMVQFNAQ